MFNFGAGAATPFEFGVSGAGSVKFSAGPIELASKDVAVEGGINIQSTKNSTPSVDFAFSRALIAAEDGANSQSATDPPKPAPPQAVDQKQAELDLSPSASPSPTIPSEVIRQVKEPIFHGSKDHILSPDMEVRRYQVNSNRLAPISTLQSHPNTDENDDLMKFVEVERITSSQKDRYAKRQRIESRQDQGSADTEDDRQIKTRQAHSTTHVDNDHQIERQVLSAPVTQMPWRPQRPWVPKPWPTFAPNLTDADFDLQTKTGKAAWIQWKYCTEAFRSDGGFKGWKWLKEYLISSTHHEVKGINQLVNKLHRYQEFEPYSFPMLDEAGSPIMGEIKKIINNESPPVGALSNNGPSLLQSTPVNDQPNSIINTSQRDVDRQSERSFSPNVVYTPQAPDDSNSTDEASVDTATVDFDAMDVLLTTRNAEEHADIDYHAGIRHAPLADEHVIREKDTGDLIPQFGLMGTYDQNTSKANSKLFLNTNIPFSAFVCGVQGSGKSYTTSCILENCLVPSKNVGILKKPLSALVFSYGQFTGDGTGFNISEAALLGAPSPHFGNAHVKKINVLVCETNLLRIRKYYERLPNVTVSCFKLDPRNLDVDLMLTLMNVDESGSVPLYMASVLQIIRRIATTSVNFDFGVFKQALKSQRFTPDQQNMLDMRLNLLESFLDLNGTYRENMKFKPGEITIMDLSCPFVDVNTACIMFKCGLQRYLQSQTCGKLVVLDEAHKYMLDVPGAKSLNETLQQTIRVQRHTGTRVVISTQEPTLLTDLIPLCSIGVIHRFTSPEWFAAIKKHIRIPEADRDMLMQHIEGLPTGTAIVYSPNSVLGYVDGKIQKGTGVLMKMNVRKRITADGGQSILAV